MKHSKHLIFMILCCLIPVAVIVVLVAFGLGGWAIFLIFLLCPLMHILLMGEHQGEHVRKPQNRKGNLEEKFSRRDPSKK